MVALLALASCIGCTYQVPARGSVEHSRACANLIKSVQLIDRLYPEDGPDPWAREAFLLQASAFAYEFECGPIGLPKALEPPRKP